MYYYWAYGLKIKSEILFPELFSLHQTIDFDIELLLGDVPLHQLEEMGSSERQIYIDDKSYKLVLTGIANYWAENGNRIVVKLQESADMSTVRLFCLSNVFAAILIQRKQIPLHAAALKVDNRLVLICGHSGAGKSTLLASLIKRGFTLFSDDVCVPVADTSQGVFMHSSYPMMKFWKDTYTSFSFLGAPDIQLRPGIDKAGFYFHDQFDINSYKPLVVFFIEKSADVSELCIREVKGVELFQKLEANAYRGEYLGSVDLRQEHFELFADLANQVKGYLVVRPEDLNSVDEITDLVVDVLEKK
ncbi:MAG: hypothetical protein RLZ10_1024 [Bacteroidota bacterium]|jgi:hypothetical protein